MLLSEEQELIRETARNFAAREIAPHAAAWDRGSVGPEPPTPKAVLKKLGALGFMGMYIDPAWGGAGADHVSYALATEEIAAADCGLCNMMCVNNSPNCAALQDHGTAEQKEAWLRPLASGAWSSAFALTEPHAGSDAAAITTRAVRNGNGYRLSGTKQFVTAGRSAEVTLVVAVTDPQAGKRGMSCFLVPTDAPGYTVLREERKLGHRAADTCQIGLEDVRVSDSARLGAEGGGYRIALAYLENGRIGVAAQAVGVARAALDAALAYAGERESFGRPIMQHQAVGFRLADMATEVAAARALTLHAATLKDAGRPCLKEASMAKLKATEMAIEVCSQAIQVHGGYGYVDDVPVAKYWRDARVLPIYEGTNDIQRMVISRALARQGADRAGRA